MIGRTLGHYRVLEPLGAGGMGEVYRAHDDNLKRDVAIKVLPENLAEDSERLARLEREAHLLASLNHPQIASIYSLEEVDGTRFLVLELVEGSTLDERLRTGPLEIEEAMSVADQIARALEAAHKKSIIHRDLKPANIKITAEGEVKVLDFGLAKISAGSREDGASDAGQESASDLTQSPTFAAATQAGVILGTAAYMSPEQARAQSLDNRTDVWSFGCVVYEMLTGHRAFRGDTVTDILATVVKDEPDWSALPEGTPANLRKLLERCLRKDAEQRLRDIGDARIEIADTVPGLDSLGEGEALSEFGADEEAKIAQQPVYRRSRTAAIAGALLALAALVAILGGLDVGGIRERFSGSARTSPRSSIRALAVLPMEDLTGDSRENDYFADGLTEALITDLSKIGDLRVIARNSVMRFKGGDQPLAEIAHQLGVDALITASVLRAASQVRVTVQLVDGETGEILWGERYERGLQDIISLQGAVVEAVADEIELALAPGQLDRLAESRSVDPRAHDAYLRGRYFLNQWSGQGIQKAIQHFQEAIDIDPTYAEAYVGLGDAFAWLAFGAFVPPETAYARAKAAAVRALELDDAHAGAHAVMAKVWAGSDWDWAMAEQEFRRSLDLNPGAASVNLEYSVFLTIMTRFDEAIARNQRAIELDPLTPTVTLNLAWTYFNAGRYDQAIAQLESLLELVPGFPLATMQLGWNYAQKGMFDEAVTACDDTLAALPEEAKETVFVVGSLGWVYGLAGEVERAQQILARFEERSESEWIDPYYVAMVHAGLGDGDGLIARLTEGFESHSPSMAFLEVEPAFDPFRSDPRFQELLRRMNFPQ